MEMVDVTIHGQSMPNPPYDLHQYFTVHTHVTIKFTGFIQFRDHGASVECDLPQQVYAGALQLYASAYPERPMLEAHFFSWLADWVQANGFISSSPYTIIHDW